MDAFKPIDSMSFDDPVTEAHEATPKEGPKERIIPIEVPNLMFPQIKATDVEKVRFVCKVQVKRQEAGKPDWTEDCGGIIEGTPTEIMNNKEHKWKVCCPKCKAEFSRGRQLHLQMDMAKAVAETIRFLASAPFEVHFIHRDATKLSGSPAPAKPA